MNQVRIGKHSVPCFPGLLDPGPYTISSGESSEMETDQCTELESQLDQLIEEMKTYRPEIEILEVQNQQRKIPKKKTIKQLFTVASKFQRNLRRGVYLACVLYHEDRVLVTNEDFLPVIEIDEIYPSSIYNDLYWFMKISCSWNETKLFRLEMEKNVSSTIHFRTKMLSAIIQMQSSLGIQDLGQVYYKPLKDSRGTMVLSTVNYIKTPKSVSLLNSKWVPTNKLYKKIVLSDDLNLSEILMASIQQQIIYHQVSTLKLNKGLYLAYFKMESSVDAIKVVAGLKSPNMLPHCKIRDNSHVTQEEWTYLKQNYYLEVVDKGSEIQRTFLELVTSACKRLFNYMDISNEDIVNHRIYDSEIIDLTKNVKFIVVCPSAELACSIPAKRELLLQRNDLLNLPLQIFEIIHLHTYKANITKKYSKLSCILEIDTITANHLHREAFSNNEVIIAKERVLKLQELEQKLNSVWKSVRWLMNVICFARDRTAPGISIRCLLQRSSPPFGMPPQTSLQIEPEGQIINKSFGRGSWPGPGNSVSADNCLSEFSKSEQNLKTKEYIASTCDNDIKLKHNKDIMSESKSESMLMKITNKCNPQRIRANTICNISSNKVKQIYGEESLINRDVSEVLQSTPNLTIDRDNIPNIKRKKSKLVSSKSMTNVKQTLKLNKFKSSHTNSDTEPILSKSLNNISTEPHMNKEESGELENKKICKGSKGLRHPFGYKNESGILQVFAAYETGLASGTSLKLHVTPRTTAREVIDLVIKQLNMAVILKGKEGPIYNPDKLNNFCLVAVIGARERCLRDDFKPLLLQNPWRKGRLYVRQKQDVLAALEHSSRHSTII